MVLYLIKVNNPTFYLERYEPSYKHPFSEETSTLMNLPPYNANEQLTHQAVDWFMRLQDEDCTQSELIAFEVWLNSDSKHTIAYEKTCNIWDVSAQLAPTLSVPSPQHLKAQHKEQQSPKQRNGLSRFARMACVALLILSSVSFMGWQLDSIPNSYHRYSAEKAIQHITLPDGSRVELNLNTQLSFANYRYHRSLILSEGEAYFQVNHNNEQPFIISAANGTITVTGTRFNVWKYQDTVIVAVSEGSVKVSSDEEESALTSGMQARYGAKGVHQELTVNKFETQQVLAWRKGQLIIDNLTLAEALPQINRYLPEPLVLASPAVAKLRIGGIYNTHDIQGLVNVLPNILPVDLIPQDDGSTQVVARYIIASPQ